MTTKLDDISEAIGGLRAEVAALRRDLQAAEVRAVDSVKRADEHRATIHRRVDDLVDEVGDLKSDVTAVKHDVAEMRPVTEDVKRWRLMGMGALAVTGIGAAAVASIVTAYWGKLVRAIAG